MSDSSSGSVLAGSALAGSVLAGSVLAGSVLRLVASLEGRDDAPVLVLGNSLGTSRAVWDAQVPLLARHFRLLRFELPGHGGLPWPPPAPGCFTVADLGCSVLALLDKCGLDRVGYCGVSLGGMIGMWLAAHAPARIAALGLCCTSAHLPPGSAWMARAHKVNSEGMDSIARQVAGRWFTPAFARSSPATVAGTVAMLCQTDPAGYGACCKAIATMDLRPVLGSVTAPTLVIAGSEDPATPPGHAALIAGQIPGARLTVIRGAAHLANLQVPGQVTAALLDHLRRAGPW
jgi:3-oxoadipate enol-lactonase